jgi:hypothetical protein
LRPPRLLVKLVHTPRCEHKTTESTARETCVY